MPPRSRSNPILDIATQEQNLPAVEARPGWATPEATEAAALEMRLIFIQCRDLGHNWRTIKTVELNESIGIVFVAWLRTLRCTRCRGLRVQHLDRQGHVVKGDSRTYAEGYLVEGLGRIAGEAKAVIRRVGIEREIAGE